MGAAKKQRYNFTISPAIKTAAAALASQRDTTLSALIESLLARELEQIDNPSCSPESEALDTN